MYQSPNADVKLLMKQNHVRQWQIAKKLHIDETTFSKKMAREKLTGEFRTLVIEAIEEVAQELSS